MDIRIRLRPWLESRLNDGWIDGLRWIDREKGIFKIPWKHHSKHTWTEDDAAIFKVSTFYIILLLKDWAVVTGRFREGVDKPDWPMWKTRLRCALNKAPDIQEVKQRHNLHCDNPFKVYRFISKTESMWRANATRNASMIFDGISTACRLGPIAVPVSSSRAEIIPSLPIQRRPAIFIQRVPGSDSIRPVAYLHRRSDGVFVKQFVNNQSVYSLHTQQSNPSQFNPNNHDITEYDSPSLNFDSIDSLSPPHHFDNNRIGNNCHVIRRISPSSAPASCYFNGISNNNQNVPLLTDILEPEYHQLGVRIQHLNVRIRDAIITNPNGCCIYYGRFDEINSPAAPDPMEAQILHHVSEANKAYVDLLLDNMIKGIILSVIQGSIYVERMCKCAVFVYIPTSDGNFLPLKKLGRRIREKIFDYDQFLTELQYYIQNEHTRPHFEVILAFGQQLRSGILTESLLVWCRVASCRAWFQLHKNRLSSSEFNNETYNDSSLYVNDFSRLEHLNNESMAENSEYIDGNYVSHTQIHRINGYHSVVKLEDMDHHINENDESNIGLVNSLDPDGVVIEQIIEEGVEVPLDDTEEITYDAPGSDLHENLIVDTETHDISVVSSDCISSSSVAHDVFLNHSDSIVLKPMLSTVHDVIISNFLHPKI